jgi:uncharacterized damage-inducible protein DinB
MKKLTMLFALSVCACQTYAQAPASVPVPNPITSGNKAIYSMIFSDVLKSAEQVSEADYSFKPTPDVRSFGALIGHIADAQYEFCGPVLADGTKSPGVEKTKTSKADLIQALKDSFAYCGKAYEGMTDVKGTEIIGFAGFKTPKLVMLSFNTAHMDEHYGNLVTYMRMKGMVPPTSQGR